MGIRIGIIYLWGFVRDDVPLIAARPAMGKTSLALNFVSRLSVEQGGTILIFSPQMWSDEITIRLLSIAMNLEPENFLNNKVPPATIAAKFLDYYEVKESSISTLRSYSPGGILIALAAARRGSVPPHLVSIVYGVDYQGI